MFEKLFIKKVTIHKYVIDIIDFQEQLFRLESRNAMVLENWGKWLNGSFVCARCGNVFLLLTFGFGVTVCPKCIFEESMSIVFDERFWLNRIIKKLY